MEKKRSVVVMVCGIIILFYSFYLLRDGVEPLFRFHRLTLFDRVRMIMSPIPLSTLLPGLIYLVAGLGILRMKKWGRLLAIYFSILFLLFMLYVVVVVAFEDPAGIEMPPLVFIMQFWPSLSFLIFLSLPKVKEQFK